MVVTKWMRLSWLIATIGTLGGCASTLNDSLAMVATQEAATMAQITNTLRQAMGTQRIEFGPHDGAYTSMLTVLPPPLGPNETRSLASPTIFDVVKRKNMCFLVRRETGTAYALANVECVVPPLLR